MFFGNPEHLSPIGQIAYKYWLEIPDHFPHVSLDEFVIMPNHVHGIIVINNNTVIDGVETPKLGVSTGDDFITTENSIKHWSPGCLGVIIYQYKRICTVKIHLDCPDFAWQPRYYEHIVRDGNALDRIREYIRRNPINWKNDRFKT